LDGLPGAVAGTSSSPSDIRGNSPIKKTKENKRTKERGKERGHQKKGTVCQSMRLILNGEMGLVRKMGREDSGAHGASQNEAAQKKI